MRNLRLGILFLLVAIAVPSAVRAETEPDFGMWAQTVLRGNLDGVAKGLRFEMDMWVRRVNSPLYYPTPGDTSVAVESPNTLVLLRPIVGYQFHPKMAAWVGYLFHPGLFDDPDQRDARNFIEHRIFTQWSLNDRFGDLVELGTRIRMEHRVRSSGPGSPERDGGLSPWAHRLRLYERLAVKFTREAPWFFVVTSESWFHFNETAYPTTPGFDQQRTFAGLGITLSEGLDRIELGYMSQIIKRTNDPHMINHIALLSAVVSLVRPH